MDTIGQRLSKCKELSGNISSYCTVANGIEVNFFYPIIHNRKNITLMAEYEMR